MSNGMDTRNRTTSKVIIFAVILTIFGSLASLVLMFALGIIDTNASISANINIVGTIPIDMVFYGVGALVVWMIYIAFMDIYDSEEIKEAKDDAVDMIEDKQDNSEDSEESS